MPRSVTRWNASGRILDVALSVQDTREETFELTGVWQSQGCSAPTQGQVGRRIAMAKAAFQAVALRKLR
jgi:hypothetical protein